MMRRAAILAIAALAAFPALAAADPAFTIRQAIDAHGGADVIEKYPAFTAKMRGTMSMMGSELPFTGELAMQVPGKFKLETNIELLGQTMAVVQIVNGDKVTQTVNGVALPLDDALRNELKQMAVMQEMTMLTSLNDAARFTLKEQPPKDKRTTIILVQSKGSKDVKLFFDNKTGLLVKLQRQAINPEMRLVSEETLLDGYQRIDGMMVPLKSTATHDGKPYMNVEFSDYKLLEKLDDAALR